MNVEEIYQQALNDPELASKLNIDEIIERERQRKLSETCWVRWTDVGVVRLDG